ncbi:MAG TPA: iron ABC transporter substrate-binding protein [Bacteroidetes bacterium]|nr:iron ABC transporter substrate-binding protein [Bacteroidota bacterium]
MNKSVLVSILVIIVALGAFFMFQQEPQPRDLVVYSGRSKALVDAAVEKFKADTGINVEVKYGGSTQLAVAIIEEGAQSPADLFWSQDAGALGAVNKAGLLKQLPSDLTNSLPETFRNNNGSWVATTARARVLAYSPERLAVEDFPASVTDLTNEKYRNRVAWAPTNASFQSFVSALILEFGVDATREWLVGVRDNGAKNFANNNAILQGIAAGEADLGITNHYYLLRTKAENPSFPVEQTVFASGDIGNMVNVAGIGQLSSSDNPAAIQFIEFLLSEETQLWFTQQVFEYPVIELDVANLPTNQIMETAPVINLEELDDLDQTLQLLREVGLL